MTSRLATTDYSQLEQIPAEVATGTIHHAKNNSKHTRMCFTTTIAQRHERHGLVTAVFKSGHHPR